MICPKCGSKNVQLITEEKKHGIVWWLLVGWWLWLVKMIGWLCIGLLMLIPKLFGHKTKLQQKAVCMDCGHRWKI